MRKMRELIGLPVLVTDSGTQIGEVKEVLLDLDAASLRGIIVTESSWLAKDQWILFDELFSIGPDAVTVRYAGVVKEIAEGFLAGFCQLKDLLDKPIFTETGYCLGSLVNVIYDNMTGEIKHYELSDGIFTDLVYGRISMPLPQVQVIGQDKLIVPDSMAKLLQIQS